MFTEAYQVKDGTVIDTGLCIIGAGAAGIALAREFQGTKLDVCLLEAGGLTYDSFSREIYQGKSMGNYLPPGSLYVGTSRLRYFGGSTNHWEGWNRPLDRLDFKKRSWIEHSGWPITEDDLKPYYERAASVLTIKPLFDDPARLVPGFSGHTFLGNSPEFLSDFFHIAPIRFGIRYQEELSKSKNINLFLHANVCDLQSDPNAQKVTQVEVKTEKGNRFWVRSKYFILATGGIENARILLLSDAVQNTGLGNESGMVGRYFMEHPHITAGKLVLSSIDSSLDHFNFFKPDYLNYSLIGKLQPTEKTQERLRLCNTGLQLIPISDAEKELEQAGSAFRSVNKVFKTSKAVEPEPRYYSLYVRAEQIPNPHSRVELNAELDSLGKRRVKLTWQLKEQDNLSIRSTLQLLAREVGRLGRGRVKLLLSESNPWPAGWYGGHHMGTTRMDADPRQGVVDENCRLHGTSNLYVAGSSVFPTSGLSNPTFTIVVMAMRLADHLKKVIR